MNTRAPLKQGLPWAIVAICAALVLLLAQRQRDLTRAYADLRRHTMLLQPGDFVPTFAARTLGGATVTIGAAPSVETRQVLFIFRTTCPYCVATLPTWRGLVDSLRRVRSPAIEVIGVSLDSANATRAYVRAHGLPYSVVLFPERRLIRLYRVAATPQTVVLNAEGRVLYARTGEIDDQVVLDSVYRAATARRPGEALPPAASGAGASREQQ